MAKTEDRLKWFGIIAAPVLFCSLVAWKLAVSYELIADLPKKVTLPQRFIKRRTSETLSKVSLLLPTGPSLTPVKPDPSQQTEAEFYLDNVAEDGD